MHARDLVLGLASRVAFRVIVGEAGFLVDELRDGGVDVVVTESLQRSVSPLDDARSLWALRDQIRDFLPQLVHTHSSKAGILGRLAARSCGVPAVHTAHAWSFSDGQPWTRVALSVPVEWAVGRVTSRFVTVSAADAAIGKRFKVATDDQIRVVYNAVPDVPERAEPRREPCTFVMVARFLAPKDHATLLDAFARVPAPARLWLVGDGPERAAAERQASRLGLGDRVGFLGARSDIPGLLAQAQVGVLSSRQEGFPLVVLEAMRAGLPVVATAVGGIAEAIDEGETGFLVPRADVDALATALSRLACDPALRARLGATSRHSFETRYGLARMLEQTLAVYQELVPSPGPVRLAEQAAAELSP